MVNTCLKAAEAPFEIGDFASVSGIQVYPEPNPRGGNLEDVTSK